MACKLERNKILAMVWELHSARTTLSVKEVGKYEAVTGILRFSFPTIWKTRPEKRKDIEVYKNMKLTLFSKNTSIFLIISKFGHRSKTL